MAVKTSWSAGDVLTAADLTDTFAAKLNLAGGKILQIVRATDTTERSTTSTSYVDVTGMSVSITPQKNTSNVMILATGLAQASWSTTLSLERGRLRITDSSNNAVSGAQDHIAGLVNITGTANRAITWPFICIAYASPATTSAVTYKLRFATDDAATTFAVRNDSSTGQMFALEVSA